MEVSARSPAWRRRLDTDRSAASTTDIDELAEIAGGALQEIQTRIGDQSHVNEAGARFPRGYVRRAGDIYWSLPEIGDNTRRRNLAYRLMRSDVCRWLLSRTDVYGQIRSVVVAEYICILAYGIVFFAMTLNYRKVARRRGLTDHTQRLVENGIIDTALRVGLDWVWNIRTHEYLDATTDLRHCPHSNRDLDRASNAWDRLLNVLQRLKRGGGVGP